MTRSHVPLRLLALLSCAGLLAVAGAVAPAATPSSATAKITPRGVGAVKLGMSYQQLRAARLVGTLIGERCEMSGPVHRSAKLRAPLKGTVGFTRAKPYRATTIVVTGGAKARGIGVGSSAADLRAAFPQAVFEQAEAEYGLLGVRVPRSGGGPMDFWIDIAPQKVALVAIPKVPLVCFE